MKIHSWEYVAYRKAKEMKAQLAFYRHWEDVWSGKIKDDRPIKISRFTKKASR